MKLIAQAAILFSLCWLSQLIEAALPFEFPASVIGMALVYLLLALRVLRVDHIREKSDFLLSNMAFFFLPAGVSILQYFDVLKSAAVQLAVICLVSTVVTFAAAAGAAGLVLRIQKGGGR